MTKSPSDRGEYRLWHVNAAHDYEFQQLSSDAVKLLFLLRLTLPPTGIGAFYLSTLVDQMGGSAKGWNADRLAGVFAELQEPKPARDYGWIDVERNVCWIVNALRFSGLQPHNKQKHVPYVRRLVRELDQRLSIVDRFCAYYPEWFAEGSSHRVSDSLSDRPSDTVSDSLSDELSDSLSNGFSDSLSHTPSQHKDVDVDKDKYKKRSGISTQREGGTVGAKSAAPVGTAPSAPPAPPAVASNSETARGRAGKRSPLRRGQVVPADIVALPEAAKAFVREFYPPGPAGSPEYARRYDVSTSLVRALNGGCRLSHGVTVFALGPERLERKIREVFDEGVRNPDKAIVVLLQKLNDTSDVTEIEAHDTRDREVAVARASDADKMLAEAWLESRPDAQAHVEQQLAAQVEVDGSSLDPEFAKYIRDISRSSFVLAAWNDAGRPVVQATEAVPHA